MSEFDEILGITPPTGEYKLEWPAKHVLTQGKNGSISDAGWKEGAEGFPQQTFLGASIRSFNLNAGFGDTTSTLSIELINDEFFKSDETSLGFGDDPYHNGVKDTFRPPVVGTPVFFKFGGNPADTEQAWRKTFDDIYGYNTLGEPSEFPTVTTNGEIERIPDRYHYLRSSTSPTGTHTWVDKSDLYKPNTRWRGKDHFVFGGILQTYTQNRSPAGNPLYSTQVVDPREILSNATVLLNNYAGTTYNNKNLLNVYGFLEHDPSKPLLDALDGTALSKSEVRKVVDNFGNIAYVGDDRYRFYQQMPTFASTYFSAGASDPLRDTLGEFFPITGQGFSRRSDKGIPWYRVKDALSALFNYNGFLPREYEEAGYGGPIDFRGYKYIVDFSGIPLHLIPQMYHLDFDQMTLLELAQELCDVISHDLFVSLLPVIDHPAVKVINDFNQFIINSAPQHSSQIIAGVIRIDAIDRSVPPQYGAIKSYLDTLTQRGIDVENQDLGYELSNVTTDKFVAGAQEVDMYYFTTNKDRDNLELRKKNNGWPNDFELLQREKWTIDTALKQQVLPFYGFLGQSKAVTIPKGFGSYQQILLDTRNLNAFGVGNYYVATELELRAAAVSYKQWKKFLLQYDEVYMQELSENQVWAGALDPEMNETNEDISEIIEGINGDLVKDQLKDLLKDSNGNERKFGVSVPRCVWRSDKNYLDEFGHPASPCSPPYGYPLYYKRAEKIGIPEGGVVSVQNAVTTAISNIGRLEKKIDSNASYFKTLKDGALEETERLRKTWTKRWQTYRNANGDTIRAFAEFKKANAELTAALGEAEQYAKDIDKQLLEADTSDRIELQAIRESVNGSKKMIKNLPNTIKNHEKNARKVYDFLKKVADENLGKRFLVKIPKRCNVNYGTDVTYHNNDIGVKNIQTGPFGFRPLPITDSPIYYGNGKPYGAIFSSMSNKISMRDSSSHYLDIDKTFGGTFDEGYLNGALKCNFNPFSEQWEFNYKPEPQGGFHNFSMGDRFLSQQEALNVPMSKLPFATQQMLSPMDMTNILKEGNRVSPYVRYDNSQHYDFSQLNSTDYSQQVFENGHWVSDILEELDNVNPDNKLSLQQVQDRNSENDLLERQKPSIAYVKCDVDENLYMPPRTHKVNTKVWSRSFKVKVSPPKKDLVVINVSGCKTEKLVTRRLQPSFSPAEPPEFIDNPDFDNSKDVDENNNSEPIKNPDFNISHRTTDFIRFNSLDFKPQEGGSGLARQNTQIVYSELRDLDDEHVYALITLPGKIKSTLDMRYIDGPLSSFNTASIYNAMTRDVVKTVEGFEKPAAITNGEEGFDCDKIRQLSLKTLSEANRLQQKAQKGAAVGSINDRLSFSSPSPIYPDMVVLPLMSMERTYGPWLSSQSVNVGNNSMGVSNLGGKIEFVKDENLAPWNFAGYQLMNQAGQLQAQFSNSLLLFSERGGFVFPQAPTGIALAKVLKQGGPLVTSIAVDIGSDKISTTVKMDLYTSSFGKLQKQKEGNIAQMSRERQKLTDARNNAIRRGLGKTATNQNLYQNVLDGGGQRLIDKTKQTTEYFSDVEKGKVEQSNQLVAFNNNWSTGKPLDDGAVDDVNALSNLEIKGVEMFNSNMETVNEVFNIMSDPAEVARQAGQSAQIAQDQIYKIVEQGVTYAKGWLPSQKPQNKRINER
jgi:hypothetical protein|tara:strand:- start:4687 stop:9690 length:5004 start_codon:yes stop_codon:yes gene_type:complete